MSTAVSPDLAALYAAVRAFLAYLLPLNTPIVKGLGNRAPPPSGPHAIMTAISQQRLSTNESTYADPGTGVGERAILESVQVEMQLDFYGPAAGDWARMAETLWRDDAGCTLLAPTCQPLFCADALNAPMVTGEQQYEQRWILRAALQYNPALTVPQQFADAAQVQLINVDVEYPP